MEQTYQTYPDLPPFFEVGLQINRQQTGQSGYRPTRPTFCLARVYAARALSVSSFPLFRIFKKGRSGRSGGTEAIKQDVFYRPTHKERVGLVGLCHG